MASQNNSQSPDNFQSPDDYGIPLTSDTLSTAQDLAYQQDLSLHQDLSPLAGVAGANILRLGEDLRRWQAEARRAGLRPLLVPILMLARRLLAAHRDWEAQEQMHLDYISLEVRVRPGAEPILIECRWSEDVHLQGTGALELRLAEPPGFDILVCVFFSKDWGQMPLSFEAAEDAQPEDAQPEDAQPEDAQPEDAQPEDAQPGSPETYDDLKDLMSSLEGFLLQVLDVTERDAPAQADNAAEAENTLYG